MPTPHISAEKGEFAPACLLPGDPKRAQVIAEELLTGAKLVTDVRGMLGFTGSYAGQEVSVMGTGMGIPSSSIYINELVADYGVERLIRVGSCGAIQDDVALRDLVIVAGASTDSAAPRNMFGFDGYAPVPDFALTSAIVAAAELASLKFHVGSVFTSDLFYGAVTPIEQIQQAGCIAIEMEAAGLFAVATRLQARAGAVLTVSDQILSNEHATSQERQDSFLDMARVALEALTADASASS